MGWLPVESNTWLEDWNFPSYPWFPGRGENFSQSLMANEFISDAYIMKPRKKINKGDSESIRTRDPELPTSWTPHFTRTEALLLRTSPLYCYIWLLVCIFLGFPGGSASKESACIVGDLGSIPWPQDPWRRAWQPIPVFLPGEFHGQRSLGGYSPWGHKELDTTEELTHKTRISRQTLRHWVLKQIPWLFCVCILAKRMDKR